MAENSIQSDDMNIAKGVVDPVSIKYLLSNSSSHVVSLQ
jgi:hypothetical protein